MTELQRVDRILAYLRQRSRGARSHEAATEIVRLISAFERTRAAVAADLDSGRPWTSYYHPHGMTV